MSSLDRYKAYKQLIAYYGCDGQVDKAIEEMAELTKALLKHRAEMKNPGGKKISDLWGDVIEELADVAVMAEQLKVMFGVTDDAMLRAMEGKIERQLERMGEG